MPRRHDGGYDDDMPCHLVERTPDPTKENDDGKEKESRANPQKLLFTLPGFPPIYNVFDA